ncbi:hypothetical protein F5882DRAFT_469957 [Hyaloscypha sp. PMI_1271]|nr:hypothetical protein F5882DRAFT_469957 [Hyaloscypha sp. PMI_1271]
MMTGIMTAIMMTVKRITDEDLFHAVKLQSWFKEGKERHVPAKLAKQTMATMMTGMMTAIIMMVVVEMTTKKLSMTRLCKILKHRRVKPKNDG